MPMTRAFRFWPAIDYHFVSRIVKRESRMAKKLSGLPAGAEAVS